MTRLFWANQLLHRSRYAKDYWPQYHTKSINYSYVPPIYSASLVELRPSLSSPSIISDLDDFLITCRGSLQMRDLDFYMAFHPLSGTPGQTGNLLVFHYTQCVQRFKDISLTGSSMMHQRSQQSRTGRGCRYSPWENHRARTECQWPRSSFKGVTEGEEFTN